MLTPEQQAILVIARLDQLPHPRDLAEGRDYGLACCPDCCAVCTILRDLLQAGTLDDVIRQADKDYYTPSAWWTGDGGVDKQWLRDCWGCQSHPPCARTP